MIVLGVDPSTVATGWGILEGNSRQARAVDWGVLKASSRKPLSERLHLIHSGLVDVLRQTPVDAIVLESAFLARNVKTAFALGQVRGVVLLASEQEGVASCEYSPLEIKRAAVGYGAADKQQVAHMMTRILGLKETPGPDEADALAAAWCHLTRVARPVVPGAAR
ncbi:MAG: crossover junction endodeoxyribonuclease RuvC [Gemmatimonadota bacterium]|nr:MAG: crossover junction endodeoxyribonuclease RuvC [Gemmatimonadota bacterium]